MTVATDPRPTDRDDTDRLRLWGLVATLAAVAVAATFANSAGRYLGDLGFEVAWRPSRTFSGLAQIWDTAGGLGRVADANPSPFAATLFSFLRAAGAEPWVAQRVWHSLLLTIAGTGCVAVVSYLAPRVGRWHALSALAYMFSPLGLGLLIPTSVYVTYAAAPWLLASALYGISRDRPWRWAAVFAIGVFASAPTDGPGAVYTSGFVVLGAVYVVHVERRSTWRHAATWAIRAGLLTAMTTAWIAMRVILSRDSLRGGADTPEAIAATSSWSESFRGAGNWLNYLALGPSNPDGNLASLLENPIVVLATFAVPIVALAALFRRSRPMSFFAVLSAVSLLVVVGLHPTGDPAPWGALARRLYDELPSISSLRHTIRAGPVHALGIAVLFGAAVDSIGRRAERGTKGGSIVTGAAVVLLALGSLPVWTGDLYSPTAQVSEIPHYWEEASEWLDAQPGDGRVMLLPGTSAPVYRWGGPDGDVFTALLDRPHVQSGLAATSTPVVDDITYSLGNRLRALGLPDQSLAPAMRRLGVQHVVVRNDLAWFDSGVPRPAALTPIREDPELRLVQTFGAAGENTTGPDDLSPAGLRQRASAAGQATEAFEATLAPVEIYELVQAPSRARLTAAGPDVVVAGDGDAWFGLASLGLLDQDRPIRFVADLDDRELTASLEAGAHAVITDTNVRRRFPGPWLSFTRSSALPPTDDGSGAGSLFGDPGAQTVSWFADAVGIGPVASDVEEPWFRAERAFDGNPATAWRVAVAEPGEGQGVAVELRQREPIGTITVLMAASSEGQIRGGHVELDDGTRLPFTVSGPEAEVDGGGRLSAGVRVIIDEIDAEGSDRPGFAEISIEGLDLEPARQVPSDLIARAQAEPALAAALGAQRLSFSFEREHEFGRPSTEAGLRRRFLTDTTRSFVLRGRLWLGLDVLASLDPAECSDWVQLDGRGVPTRLISELDPDLGTSEFESCEPVEITGGWHLLEDRAGARLDRVELDEGDLPERGPATTHASPAVVDRGPTHLTVEAETSTGSVALVSGIAFDRGWKAVVDGASHETIKLDGQVAVRLDDPGSHRVELVFAPQRLYDAVVLMSVLAAVGCLVLALTHPRRKGEPPAGSAT